MVVTVMSVLLAFEVSSTADEKRGPFSNYNGFKQEEAIIIGGKVLRTRTHTSSIAICRSINYSPSNCVVM